MGAAVAVPVSETTELAAVLSVMVTVPIADPAAVGVKVTLTVQMPPGATADVQVLVAANGAVAVTPVTVRLAVPVFVIVTTCTALVVLTTWVAKVRLAGDSETAGCDCPVPVSNTTCGLPGAVSLIVRAPMVAAG